MNSLKIPQFNEMIQFISVDSRFKDAVAKANIIYLTKPLALETLTPPLVVQLVNRNLDKPTTAKTSNEAKGQTLGQTVWLLNQFKVFVWISVCYGYMKAKQFQNFNSDDYQLLHSLFTRKSAVFLEYHLKNLTRQVKTNKEKWAQAQIDLLVRIIKQEGFTFKWSEISFRLFDQSNKTFFRTAQKCREKWFNHLDPEVNRMKWTLEEDFSLFSSIINYGLKWALISKIFNGSRTEHMIKNRYNSLAKKYQSKSNRLSTKKLIDRIHSDLYRKVHGVKLQDSQEIMAKEESDEPKEYVNIEPKTESSTQIEIKIPQSLVMMKPKLEYFSETSQQNFLEWQEKTMRLKQLRDFDLERVLLSESIGDIQRPFKSLGQVELMVEMFAELPKGDQYLSFFF